MSGTRYSFEQISKVSGITVYRLEERRRQLGVEWHPKGYTVEEVTRILCWHPLLEREKINPRAYKALELHDRLTEEAQA